MNFFIIRRLYGVRNKKSGGFLDETNKLQKHKNNNIY